MNKHMNMWDTIQAAVAKPVVALPCPCCGFDPLPCRQIGSRYFMACEADGSQHTFEAWGATPAEALAHWNKRP